MGILTTFRRSVANAIELFTGPPPLELACISGETSADLVYEGFRSGLRVLVMRDYPEAPWAWSIEGGDGRLVAFQGSVPSYEAAVLAASEWLASPARVACQAPLPEPFDGTPRAA